MDLSSLTDLPRIIGGAVTAAFILGAFLFVVSWSLHR